MFISIFFISILDKCLLTVFYLYPDIFLVINTDYECIDRTSHVDREIFKRVLPPFQDTRHLGSRRLSPVQRSDSSLDAWPSNMNAPPPPSISILYIL